MDPLVFLRVQHERLPDSSVFQHDLKRSLLAASLHFDLKKASDRLSVEGHADVKFPLKRPWRFEATALWTKGIASIPIDFELTTEREVNSNRLREWRRDGARLLFREFENGTIRRESDFAVEADHVPVCSPILLISALQCSIESPSATYGTLLVAGSKFSALRLTPKSSSEKTAVFNGAIVSSRRPLSSEQWLALPWNDARPFELEWSFERRTLQKLTAEVPLLGAFSLSF